MLNKILLSLYVIIGVMLVVTMLIYSLYSLYSELEIIDNQDRDYQEHIQRESR